MRMRISGEIRTHMLLKGHLKIGGTIYGVRISDIDMSTLIIPVSQIVIFRAHIT